MNILSNNQRDEQQQAQDPQNSQYQIDNSWGNWHKFEDDSTEMDLLDEEKIEYVFFLKFREKSLVEQLKQVLSDNQETLLMSTRLRYIYRITVLFMITLGLLKIFWIIKNDFAVYNGFVSIKNNINLNIQNCKIIIEDKKYSHIQRKYMDFLASEQQSNFNNDEHLPKILLEYYIPGRFNIDPFAEVSTINITKNSSSFINILSTQNCIIQIFVFERIQVDTMSLNCSKSCYIIQKSQNITYSDININGDLIESNFNNLVANNINYQTTQGRFQGNRVTFKNFSNINIESGDIIIQTDQEIQLNWTHAIPNYCLSAPVVANPIVIGCEMPKDEDIKKYLTGIGSQNKEDQRIKNNDEISEESEEETAGEEEQEDKQGVSSKMSNKKLKTFFEDQEGDPNIFLFDDLPNYEQTLDYQNIQKKMQDEIQKSKKKRIGKFMNLNFHLKKLQKSQEAQLFNPSCYGSILLCQSQGCSEIKNQHKHKMSLKKQKKQKKKNQYHFRILNNKFDRFEFIKEHIEEQSDISEEEEKFESEEPQNGKQQVKDNQSNQQSIDNQARSILPHKITDGIPFLNLTGRFGNIYVNIINESIIVNGEQTVVLYGSAYNTQNINFSLPSIKKIYDAHKDSKNPHNFDPSFIFGIGSKQSESDNYQQWQLTFNPAYSYLRPWWIGTFSFTLLSTSTYPLELQLSPGFCPYVPTADIRHLYQTGYLINGYFPEAEHSISTYSIQEGLDFPWTLNQSTDGFKYFIESNNIEEKWYQISKINETNFKITSIDLNQSLVTEWAVKVSIILSMITALILLIGLIYIIIQVYDGIVNQVESIKKYRDIEQKDEDENNKQPLLQVDYKKQLGYEDYKKNNKQEVAFTFNPFKMIYFLLVKAPPLSAFIDYLLIFVTKKFRNSAEEFYQHLFQERDTVEDSDDIEQMLSIDFKMLYEKFCYLNGFLEQKLDDSDNLKHLSKYGFCINKQLGAQTECYVRVLFDKMAKLKEIPQNKTSLQLFIEKCCRLTNFEQDCITLQSFNERYDEFCISNHLTREIISNSQLKEYNIQIEFISLQNVERINKTEQKNQNQNQNQNQNDLDLLWYEKFYDFFNNLFQRLQPEQKIYVINQKKLENHFYLIMDNIQLIKTREELLIANREIILYPGWFIWDFFTVLFHFFTTIILIIPLFSFTILEKILYYPYSLIPSNNLISQEDIFHNIWLIPDKLSQESAWIRNILILVMIYWIYSIIDLIYYYFNMEFPQEKFFRKTQQVSTNRIQFIFRQIMWILVLYSAYQLFVFLSLAGVWLVLGGIVNPSAFLPYATAAATFITVVVSKASQYKEIAEEGFHAVIEQVEKLSNSQFAGLLKKYELKGKINKVLDNEAVQSLAEAAAGMGLVDQDIIQHIRQRIDQDPKLSKKGGKNKFKQLEEDPKSYFDDLQCKLENKGKQIINTQISKQINIYGELVAQLIISMTQENLEEVHNSIVRILQLANNQPNSQQFKSLNLGTLPLIFQLAETFILSENNNDSFTQSLLFNIADCLSYIIYLTINEQDKLKVVAREDLSQCILKSLQIESNLQQFNTQQIYNDFQEILKQQSQNQMQFKRLLRYTGLLQLTVTLFEGKRDQISLPQTIEHVKQYIMSEFEFKDMKNLIGYFDLTLQSFQQQITWTSTKQNIENIQQFLEFSAQQLNPSSKRIAEENVQLVALWFNFVFNNFDEVSNSIIHEYISQLAIKPENQFLNQFLLVQDETKQFVDLFSNMLNMMTLFMDRPSETKKIYQQPQTSFQIEPDRAKALIQFLQFSTKMILTQENSSKENELVVQFSDTNIFQSIQNKLRISKQLLLGITMFLLNKFKRPEFQFLLDSISQINQVDVQRIRQFISIVFFQLTDDEQYLADAVQNLSFPSEYLYLILNFKKQETIPYYQDTLLKLGFSEEQIQEIMNQQSDESRNQALYRNCPYNLYSLQYQLLDQNEDLDKKLQNLNNNENKLLLLTKKEINLAKQIQKLRGIQFQPCSQQLMSTQKQSIQELSEILNINKDLLEDYVNLLFVNNPNQSMMLLKSFQKNEEIITFSKQIRYQQFIKHIQYKTLLLNKKQDKINNALKQKILAKGLPIKLINKILMNKYQQIDMMTFYQCSKLIISTVENAGDDYYMYLDKLKPVIKYMTNSIELSDKTIQDLVHKNDLSKGFFNLLRLYSELNQEKKLQQFINHLYNNQKQSKFDQKNTVPQFYLTNLCLYLFFRGKINQLFVELHSESKNINIKVNILEYINQQYNIPPEFFESIHAIFLKDKQQFIKVMTKFNRKYQQLKIFEESSQNQIIPLNSLFRVQDNLIINLLNLLDGEFQPNYFAKLLKINKQLLDFIAALSKIIVNQDNLIQRRIQINNLQKSNQQAFEKLQLDQEEFILILQLLYQDTSASQVNKMVELFGLKDKIQQSTLLNLMQIDKAFPLEKGRQECLKQLNFNSNDLIGQLGLNKALVISTKILINGATSLIDKVFGYYPQFFHVSNQQYLEIIKALVSCISGQMNESNLNLIEFSKHAKQAIKDQTYKPEFVKENFNGQEYAMFVFNKYFKILPEFILLLNGQESFWRNLQSIFSGTYQKQIACLHPLIVLESLVVFKQLPLVMKKVITDYEFERYLKRLNKQFNLNQKIKKTGTSIKKIEFQNALKQHYQNGQINYWDLRDQAYLQKVNWPQLNFNDKEDDRDNKEGVLKKYQNRALFASLEKVFKFIKDDELKAQFKFLIRQVKDNEQVYRDMIYEDLIDKVMIGRNPQLIKDMKEMKPYLIFSYQRSAIYKIYLFELLTDKYSYDEDEYYKSTVTKLIDSDTENLYIFLFVLIELFSLNSRNQPDDDKQYKNEEDLKQTVILKLEYILNFIEKFFFFTEFVDIMSKNQLIQLLGLSAGFALKTEDIIKAKLTEQIFDYKFCQQYCQMKSKTLNAQIQYKFDYIFKVEMQNQNKRIFQQSENLQINYSEQIINYEDYFLDLPMVDEKSDFYQFIKINGKQLSSLNNREIQEEIQICLNRMFSPIYYQHENGLLSLQEIKDPKSGFDWKQQLQNMKNWREQTQQENFKLILSILKRNYQYLLDSNSYLMQQPLQGQIIYGIVALQGAQLKNKQGVYELDMSQFQKCINSFTLDCKSNKRVLLELLGIFVGNFSYAWEICEIYQQDRELISTMIELACRLYSNPQYGIYQIKNQIFRYLQLLPTDEVCLENTLRFFVGQISLLNQINSFNTIYSKKKNSRVMNEIIQKKRPQAYNLSLQNQKLIINYQQNNVEKYYDYLGKTNQLLDSLNPNYYHQMQNVDFSQLDFFQYIIQYERDVFEYLYLMTQHLTKEIDDKIFNYRDTLNYKDDEWNQAINYVQELKGFYDDLINNSSQSIQTQSKELVDLLISMKLIENTDELEIINGLSALQPRYYQKTFRDNMMDKQLKIINNLNIIRLENKEEGKQLEKLYIGLCQNEFSFIYSSLLKFNKFQAANLLSIFYMKNFNIILHFLGLKNVENYKLIESNIIFHLILFQLNNYSRALELIAKNIQNLDQFGTQDDQISECTIQILMKIDQLYQNEEEACNEIRKIKTLLKQLMNNPKTSNYNNKFSWSHWIISYPQLNDCLDFYIREVDPQYTKILTQSKQFFKILMGIELHETIRQGEFFSSTVTNYVDLSKIISYPLLLNEQVDLNDLHRPYIEVSKSNINNEQAEYINLFNKLIDIIILTQIPSKNLNQLELRLKNQEENLQNEQYKQSMVDEENDQDVEDQDYEKEYELENQTEQNAKILDNLSKDPIKSVSDFDIVISNKIQLQIKTIISVLIKLHQQQDQSKITNEINLLKDQMIASLNKRDQFLELINEQTIKYNKLEKEFNEVESILNKLVELFSGFTISQEYSQQKVIIQRDKNKQINELIDQMLFINIKVKNYISTKIINSIYQQLIILSNSPIMSIADSEYQEKVLILLHVMTDQEPYSDEMKQKFQERKIFCGTQGQNRKQLIPFPMKTIIAIFEILQFKMNGVGLLLQELGVGEQSIKFVMQNLNQMEKMGVFDQQQELVVEEEEEDEKVQKAMELMKKVEKGEANSSDLFKFVDEDQSNSISKQEYKIIAKRLGMDLSDHRVNEIFASFKKGQQNQNDESQMDNLNEREFEKAMEYLRSKNTNMSLDFLGISSGLLTIMLIIIAIIMILTFVFVFLGIKAFALGGTFGAIINSFIPIAAGGSASGKAEKIDDSRRNKQSIKESVEKTQQIIQSSQL